MFDDKNGNEMAELERRLWTAADPAWASLPLLQLPDPAVTGAPLSQSKATPFSFGPKIARRYLRANGACTHQPRATPWGLGQLPIHQP
jgi:hypothetical protein